jgi:hypothetical protein
MGLQQQLDAFKADFTLPNHQGEPVSLASLLRSVPVVVTSSTTRVPVGANAADREETS